MCDCWVRIWGWVEPETRSGEKKIILCFVDYFALLVNGFWCGYAHFEGAGQALSEHQKNRKTVDKSLIKLNFSARPWEIVGKYMDLNWKFIECGCITVQKHLKIIGYLHFSLFFQGLALKVKILIDA